jgi:hypothetical protein
VPVVFRVMLLIAAVIGVLTAIGWVGLQIPPRSYAVETIGETPHTLTIPEDLPPPVLRYASAVYGDNVPDVRSAEVLGRASIMRGGLQMPARFRFYYDAVNPSHYHQIEVTWFTLPIMNVHERFLNGQAILDVPGERIEDDPFTDSASRQGYWAEVLAWVPAIVLHEPQIRWDVVDENTVRMIIPDAPDEEALLVSFDPESRLIQTISAMRYGSIVAGQREQWRCRGLEWSLIDGVPTMERSDIRWNDDAPWVVWQVEQVALNVDVAARMQQFGGESQ